MGKNKHIFLFSFLMLYFGFFAWAGVDTIHDGIMLKPALDVLSGKILFRETYTQYGALSVFIQTAFMAVFGPNLWALRASAVTAYAVIGILLVFVWRRFLKREMLVFSFILWLTLAPIYGQSLHSWSSVYALVFQCAAILCFFRYADTGRSAYMFCAGIHTALIFWCRQPVGVFTALGFIVIIIFRKNFRLLIPFLSGIFLASLPFGIYIVGNGALADWWKQSILGASSWAATVRGVSIIQVIKSLSIAKSLLSDWGNWIWAAIPLSVILFTYIRRKDFPAFGFGILCLASWMQYYPMADASHYFWAATPMVGLFTLALYRIFRNKTFRVVSWGILLLYAFSRIFTGSVRVIACDRRLETPAFLSGIRLNAFEETYFRDHTAILTEFFRKEPRGTYINHSVDSMVTILGPRYVSPHLIFVNSSFLYTTVYREYETRMFEYARNHHALVYSRQMEKWPGYCAIRAPFREDQPIRILLKPADAVTYNTTEISRRYPAVCQ